MVWFSVFRDIRLFLLGIGAFDALHALKPRSQKFVHYTHDGLPSGCPFPWKLNMNNVHWKLYKLQETIMYITKMKSTWQVQVEVHLRFEKNMNIRSIFELIVSLARSKVFWIHINLTGNIHSNHVVNKKSRRKKIF